MFSIVKPRLTKLCTKTLFLLSVGGLLLLVLLSRNYMFSSCPLRDSILRNYGSKGMQDIHTKVFQKGSFMKGNVVIEEDDLIQTNNEDKVPSTTSAHEISYKEALKLKSVNKTIILSIVDKQYTLIAINFFKTSLQKFNLNNYLMICTDDESYNNLRKSGIFCIHHPAHFVSHSGDFGSEGYFATTNLKSLFVLQALELGYKVLMADLDIILFENPFNYFLCDTCDLHITRDRTQVNSGFIFVRPSNLSIYFYKTIIKLYEKYKKSHDQTYLNSALQVLQNEGKKLKLEELPPDKFICGVYYFQNGGREFAGKKCPGCVMIHNNYIGSVAAKVYRFKENLMWVVDNAQYYSNPDAQFLLYGNPRYFENETWEKEIYALKVAMVLGNALNRKVVLPKFHCCNCKENKCENEKHRCSLLSVLKISTFDEYFLQDYREHMFFENSAVPNVFKNALKNRPIVLLKNDTNIDDKNKSSSDQNINILASIHDTVPTLKEVIDFANQFSNDKIIEFHSLYSVKLSNSSLVSIPVNNLNISLAFQCIGQQQWNMGERLS